ncbi:response regulator [Leptospira sp. 96542]|nr:response regulator [Leptospira sp. 96542]
MKTATKTVLVVDDDDLALDSIRSMLGSSEFEIETASDGIEALEKLSKSNYLVVVTDLQMPRMNGVDLVAQIKGLPRKPIIIVASVVADIDSVTMLMREGVYDYIQKPYNYDNLISRLERAFEVAELRAIKARSESERALRIQEQLNWNLWKEKIIKGNTDASDNQLIGSIRTSLSQGAGFGALVSLIKRIQKKSILQADQYLVPAVLMESLFENGHAAKQVIDLFEEMELIGSNDLNATYLSIADIYQLLDDVILEVNEFSSINNHTILLGKNSYTVLNSFILGNAEYLKKAFKEIIFNALKFSIPDSKIYITLAKQDDKFLLGFLNPPEKDQHGNYGIDEVYENLIFEPFFRISKLVYEKYPTMDFGLGLTYVDKVIRKHAGLVRPFLVRNYLDSMGSKYFVNFEVELPLSQIS